MGGGLARVEINSPLSIFSRAGAYDVIEFQEAAMRQRWQDLLLHGLCPIP